MEIDFSEFSQFLQKWIEKGAFPGAAYAMVVKGEVVTGAVGNHTFCPDSSKVTDETIFDLASLTKVISPTSVAMATWGSAEQVRGIKVKDILSDFSDESVTLGHLLRHDSGLPAYLGSLAAKVDDTDLARLTVCKTELRAEPGEKTVYSCLNMIVMMLVLEKVHGKGLDVLFGEIAQKVGAKTLGYKPKAQAVCAPTTNWEDWRKKKAVLRGEEDRIGEYLRGDVHDPMAYTVGSVSGNAGLFGSAKDLGQFAKAWVTNPEMFTADFENWTTRQSSASSRGLGWDCKSARGSSAGTKFSMKSFGHLGYTGTSLWIDPENEIALALLTNRVHPDDKSNLIRQVRPAAHDLFFKILGLR